ncbi:GABR1-like protein [Mya arenaria]|uniref:GABR1-like protein n=1 Tax=Mya arenaria TaxID=6604 RepID=A0ABY7G8Z9_MYAAR|nr:GABR1-like protein [Mya arenaria]
MPVTFINCMPGLGTKVLYELLYTQPKKLIVLTGCSIVSTFVAQAAKMWNLVVLAYGSSSPALSNRDRFPTFFRTHPSATLHNPTRVKIFERYNSESESQNNSQAVSEYDHLTLQTVEDLEERVKTAGIEVAVRQNFLTDPTNAVRNLKRQDARIIVGVFYEDMARRVFCQAYKEKLYGRKYVWFIIGWYPNNWYKVKDESINCTSDQLKEALEGHITTEAVILHQENTTAQTFKQRLDAVLNVPDTSQVGGYPEAPLAYDAVWALALALNKTAERFLGVSGNVAFSSQGDRIAWTKIEQMTNDHPPPDRTMQKPILRVVSLGLFLSMCGLSVVGIIAGVLRAWLLSIGFSLGYGGMFSKIWAVHRLTTSRQKDKKDVKHCELFLVLIIILTIDLIILTTWQVIDPMYRDLEIFDLEPSPTTEHDIMLKPYLEHCHSHNNSIWLGVIFGHKGILLLFGIFLSYETRSVKLKQVNDSRFVGMSIYNVVFIEILRNPKRSAHEIRSLTESVVGKEEEERHQKLLTENEQLKKQIAEGHNSNSTSELPANTVNSLEPPSIRTPDRYAISTDCYSDSGVHTSSTIVKSPRYSPTDHAV